MALPEINRGREKADKAQFLREVYDVTFSGGEARQNLWKKVIPDAKKVEKVEKVNDVKAQEWLREERRRAEERAEKRWKQKFEEWQANYQQEIANAHPQESEEEVKEVKEVKEVQAQPESPKFLDKEQQAWKTRAEAAEKEVEELRSECKGQLNELERLYEEFRRVRRDAMDERARREKIEKHLEMVAQDHEAWRLRSEKREEQLQQVRAQRRRVASGIALFGNKMLDLERQSEESLSQASADKGEEPPATNEAAAALDFAGKTLAEARFQNQAMAEFLASEDVRHIHSTDAATPREDSLLGPVAEDGPEDSLPDSPEESPTAREGQSEPGEQNPVTEDSPPDSPGARSPTTVREGQSEPGEQHPVTEASPPDSPGERSPTTVREGQSEPGEQNSAAEDSPPDPDSPITAKEARSLAGDGDSVTEALDAIGLAKQVEEAENTVASALAEHLEAIPQERPTTVTTVLTEGQSAASYTEAVAGKLIRMLSSQAQVKLAAEQS